MGEQQLCKNVKLYGVLLNDNILINFHILI